MTEKWFEGRTALVTGGARGIGRAICETLARRGAHLAVNYRTSQRKAEETVSKIIAAGSRAVAIRADISDRDQGTTMVRQVTEQLGPVELLVNNASVLNRIAPDELTPEIWQQTLGVNLTGTYLVTWAVKDSMILRRFGRIVNISSIAALRPRPRSIAYAVTKAGLVALTKGCAEAFAPYNIRVNCVAPGLIETNMIAAVESQLIEKFIAETPMGRIGQPDEIASVVEFLLSDASRFITGQTLIASGGRVMVP